MARIRPAAVILSQNDATRFVGSAACSSGHCVHRGRLNKVGMRLPAFFTKKPHSLNFKECGFSFVRAV